MKLALFSYAAVIAGSMAVAGCDQTKYSDIITGQISSRAAKAEDQTVRNLEWGLCNAISVGAVRRNYVEGRKWSAYAVICGWPDGFVGANAPRNLVPGKEG